MAANATATAGDHAKVTSGAGDKLSCFSAPRLKGLYNGSDRHEAVIMMPLPEGRSVALGHHQGLLQSSLGWLSVAPAEICHMEQLRLTDDWFLLLSFNVPTEVSLKATL